jgi:Rrf2 family protein
MKISTRSRYGVRALVDLAIEESSTPISLKTIAKRQCLTPKYLERLFADLKKAGIVFGYRGATGGYRLARKAEDIRISEVVRVLEKSLVIDCIHINGSCESQDNCLTQLIWQEIEDAIFERLDKFSIADLARRSPTPPLAATETT